MNNEKNKQSFLWNLKCKIQEHFKNKSLKTHYFKDFSRTNYNSRTFQGIQGIQEPLATLQLLCFLLYLDNYSGASWTLDPLNFMKIKKISWFVDSLASNTMCFFHYSKTFISNKYKNLHLEMKLGKDIWLPIFKFHGQIFSNP